MSVHIGESDEKSIFERAIIEAFKQKNSKEMIEKLIIAMDEIKFNVKEIRDGITVSKQESKGESIIAKSSKYLLNINILDKLRRILERRLFSVNIVIARIFYNLLDTNNFDILSNDLTLLVTFANEVLNLLDTIKSAKISNLLEKKCSAYLNFLMFIPNLNNEQKLIIQELIEGFPNRYSSEAFKQVS